MDGSETDMENSNTDAGKLLFKHMTSMAEDACFDFEIDRSRRTVVIRTFTQRMRPFIPASMLQAFMVRTLASDYGIVAWDDDEKRTRTSWTVLLIVGDLRFTVSLTKQFEASSCGGGWALELYPVESRA